jgi:hypothetical protein
MKSTTVITKKWINQNNRGVMNHKLRINHWMKILLAALAVSGILATLLNVGLALAKTGTVLASVSWNG